MYVFADDQLRKRPRLSIARFSMRLFLCLAAASCFCSVPVIAQEADPHVGADAPAGNEQAKYVPAIQLLPDSVAGLIRIPNLPKFCDAYEKTHAGQLMDEESMQPFIEAQRARAKNYLRIDRQQNWHSAGRLIRHRFR